MSAKGILVIGAGRRVTSTALPALARSREQWELQGLFARSARELEIDGGRYKVEPLEDLSAARLAQADLVYVAVGKPAAPAVLSKLVGLDARQTALLIDTPVLLIKHFHHLGLLRKFRTVSVAEDVVALPWLDPVKEALAAGSLGELSSADFFHSLYAYHGVAVVKRLFGSRVRSARRRPDGEGGHSRRYVLSCGREARVLDPRDYSRGRVLLSCTGGSLADHEDGREGCLPLEPILEGVHCVGFRAGEHLVRLDPDEVALMRGDGPDLGVTARMEAMKRVGFLRLLRRLHSGECAYPLEEALDDMLIDYSLEKLGRYRDTPLTSARSGVARLALGLVARLAGR